MAKHTYHGQAHPTKYQRYCMREMENDGYEFVEIRHWNSDDDFSISANVRKGGYMGLISFPRTRAIEKFYTDRTYYYGTLEDA